MIPKAISYRTSSGWWTALLFLAVTQAALPAQSSALGKVDFPTSGSSTARACFLRGVAALHSFWYEEAADQFRECTKAEPAFMMGYWGEAMTYNHPIWHEQDAESARAVLAKITDTSKLTAREGSYIDAARILFGTGDKLSRDLAYSKAMEKIHKDYPDDLEAACFYALSLLGTVRPGDKGFSRQMRAGAIALDVYQKNPDHPGAAHYIIHSFDDPEHAVLALPAARRYADIAPDAHHARHMPSHIFLQLGMWPEEIASNISAWHASVNWVERKHLPLTLHDSHSLYWELYGLLQVGRYAAAEALLEQKRRDVVDSHGAASLYASQMAAAYLIGTERWSYADHIFSMSGADNAPAAHDESSSGAHAAHAPGPAEALTAFATGYAAAATGLREVRHSISALDAIAKGIMEPALEHRKRQVEIQKLELEALAASKKGDHDNAVRIIKQAVILEEMNSPPSGPPDEIKPPHELCGELMLAAGLSRDAAQMFAISLAREPNRARSLLGSARAARAIGNMPDAALAYAEFLRMWHEADPQIPELAEVRNMAKSMERE